MKIFNIGLVMMVFAVVALPIATLLNTSNRNIISYSFYFCGLLELIGLIFVLIHIITLKNKNL